MISIKNVDQEFQDLAKEKLQQLQNERDGLSTTTEQAERIYTLLHWQIASKIFRGHTSAHPYSTGRTFANMVTERSKGKWSIIISPNVEYSAFALGFGSNGLRIPRSDRETNNFKIIQSSIKSVTRIVGSKFIGGVYYDGNKI